MALPSVCHTAVFVELLLLAITFVAQPALASSRPVATCESMRSEWTRFAQQHNISSTDDFCQRIAELPEAQRLALLRDDGSLPCRVNSWSDFDSPSLPEHNGSFHNATRQRVAIIGGGIAGLYAADLLRGMRVDVTVFEAQDDVHGRILSHSFPDSNSWVDLGAMRFKPNDEVLLNQLIQEHRLPVIPMSVAASRQW